MDKNKTRLTHELTVTAAYWLNLRGFKIVEPKDLDKQIENMRAKDEQISAN